MLPNVDRRRQLAGRSFDPETKIFYIFSNTSVSALGLVPGNPARNGLRLRAGHRARSERAGAGRPRRRAAAAPPAAAAAALRMAAAARPPAAERGSGRRPRQAPAGGGGGGEGGGGG